MNLKTRLKRLEKKRGERGHLADLASELQAAIDRKKKNPCRTRKSEEEIRQWAKEARDRILGGKNEEK